MPKLKKDQTTVRDFGGGWNVADSDLNLSSKFQPVSINVIRGSDGSMSVRWGTELFVDFRDGTTSDTNAAGTIEIVNTAAYLKVNDTAHGLATGDHITISGQSAIGNIPASDINRTHGVLVIDVDTYRVPLRTVASSSTTVAIDGTFIRDTHTLAGNIIHKQYFNRRLVVFDDIGEVGTITDAGAFERIWDYGKAEALTAGLLPTRWCDFWSSASFKSTLIACNGYDKDKPLQIDEDFNVEFLVDKATLSNSAVPRADFVVGMHGYVIFFRTEYGDAFAEFSAKNTDGTFTREAAPDDAVEVDLSMITNTVEPVLLGAGPLRDKLYVAFYDRGMIGTIGVYNGADHEPNFEDAIAEHGVISHRTVVPLGNDIFMCDYAGVPSVAISQQSGIHVPVRVSELIAPAIQAHLSNLSEDTLRTKAYAFFNKNDRSYMLFLPKCDEVAQALDTDPFFFNDSLRENNQAYVIAKNHRLFDRSFVTVAGATDIGTLLAADINGVREVVSIVNDDAFIIQLGSAPDQSTIIDGGGDAVTITPVNDETIGYVFEFNKELRIRRWTQFRGMDFDCGAVSQRGTVFLSKGGRVYKYGSKSEPIHADLVGNYDAAWENNTAYAVDYKALDEDDGKTYICIEAHTSAAAGTFAADRADNLDYWEEYQGEAIEWDVETPWSDLGQRGVVKKLDYVSFDTEGTGQFTFKVFADSIRIDPETYVTTANREMQFTAGDAGGFGVANTPDLFGSGRRTREARLWPIAVRGKLLRLGWSGSTKLPVRIISVTMYYSYGSVRK